MATSALEHVDRSMSIGRVFSRAFGTIATNPLPTLGIAFLFGALPTIFLTHVAVLARDSAFSALGAPAAVSLGLLSFLVSIILGVITQGALVRATVAHSKGEKASFSESALAGLRVGIPLVLLGLLSSVGIGLGLLFLLVPGVILYMMWSVAGPVLVEERLGPIGALSRSRALTSGARWKIFGLILVLIVLYWMLSGLVAVIAAASSGGMEPFLDGDYLSMPAVALMMGILLQTITSAVWGVILTALYVELRNWKDGPAADALADIFG